MCAVSFVGDFYGQYPTPTPKPIPWQNLPPTLPWTPDTFAELQKIMKRLDELDRKLGLAGCEDPKKVAWMKETEARVKALEQPKRKRKRTRA